MLPVKVEAVTVTDPLPWLSALSIAPPSQVALLQVKVLPVQVTVPALSSPPPMGKPPAVLFPLAMVSPVRARFSPDGTVSTGPLHAALLQPVLAPLFPSSAGGLASPGAG